MATSPILWSIETFVAWVTLHSKVDDCPASIVEGSAEKFTKGSGAGAVDGSDGAGALMGAFFLQPCTGINDKSTKASKVRFEIGLFIIRFAHLPLIP